MKVHRDWYRQIKEARKDVKKAQNRLRNAEGVLSVGLSKSNSKFGGENGLKINIGVDPDNGVGVAIPQDVGGTKIDIEEKEKKVPLGNGEPPCRYSMPWGDGQLYGGSMMLSSGVFQTNGPPIEDGQGNKYMLTTAHGFYDDDPCNIGVEDILESSVSHKSSSDAPSDLVGFVTDGSIKGDIAVYDNSASISDYEFIAGGVSGVYWAWYGEDFLDAHASDNRSAEIFKTGAATGLTGSGDVKETHVEETGDNSSCTTLHGHGVEVSIGVDKGDSGCPITGPQFYMPGYYDLGPGSQVVGITHSANIDKRIEYTCGMDPTGDRLTAYPMYDLDDRYPYHLSCVAESQTSQQ